MTSNIVQIVVPIFGLFIMCLLRECLKSNMDVFANLQVAVPVPALFNVPLKPFSGFGKFFNVTDCNEWYMYHYNTTTSSDDQTAKIFG